MSVGRFAADLTRGDASVGLPLVEQRLGGNLETRDWRLLDRHAARTGSTLADLDRRHLEPLLMRLAQSAG